VQRYLLQAVRKENADDVRVSCRRFVGGAFGCTGLVPQTGGDGRCWGRWSWNARSLVLNAAADVWLG